MPFVPALASTVLGGAAAAAPSAAIAGGVAAGADALDKPGGGGGYGGGKIDPKLLAYGGKPAQEAEFDNIPAKPGEPGAIQLPGPPGAPPIWVKRVQTKAAVASGADQATARMQGVGQKLGDKYGKMAATPVALNTGAADQARGLQGQAFQNEQGVINGTAPSLAQAQLRQGQADAVNAGRSMAAGAVGGAGAQASALRRAQAMANQGQLSTNNQAATLRAQEVAGARANASNVAAQMRGADEGRAVQQGQLNVQNRLGLSNLEAGTRGQFEGMGNQIQAQQLQANTAGGIAQMEDTTRNRSIMSGEAAADTKRGDDWAKFGIGTVGGLLGKAAGSDERMKTNIRPINVSQGINPGDEGPGPAAPSVATPSVGRKPNSGKNVGGQQYAIDEHGHQSFLSKGGGDFGANNEADHSGDEKSAYEQGLSIGASVGGALGGGGGGAKEPASQYSESADKQRYAEQMSSIPGSGIAAPQADAPPMQTWGGSPGEVSDERKKTNKKPMGDAEAAKLSGEARKAFGYGDVDAAKSSVAGMMASMNHPKASVDTSEASEAARQWTPYSYNYKPETGEDPSKTHFGPMAQDLEKTPMGASLVHETPTGKVVDTGRASLVALAQAGNLQRQIDEMRAGAAAPPATAKTQARAEPPNALQRYAPNEDSKIAAYLAGR